MVTWRTGPLSCGRRYFDARGDGLFETAPSEFGGRGVSGAAPRLGKEWAIWRARSGSKPLLQRAVRR